MLWQPCAARFKDLMSIETALCCGSLVLQKRKDLLSFSNGPTFAVLVMLRTETLPLFSPLRKEQRNSSAKKCVTRQKSKTRPGNYSRPNQGETSLRAIRVQRHATILRTLQWPKIFSGKFGEIRAKILRTPQNLPAPTPVVKPFTTIIPKHIVCPCVRFSG